MRRYFIGILIIIIQLMFRGSVLQANEPKAAPPEGTYSSFTLRELGEKNIVVRTIFDQIEVIFPLAEGREIRWAVLKLRLSHGIKLLPESSDLTIALNNEPVASLILTPENAAANFIDLPLPVEAFQPGPNRLTFRFNQRLREKGCKDIHEPGLWTKIWSATAIELYSVDAPIVPALERFPAPFDTLTMLDKSPHLYMILPPQPTSVELTVASQIAAALGQAANWENPPLHALTVGQLEIEQLADHHMIVIDRGGRNPLAAEAEAGLSERLSPYNPNRLMLVVSAPNEVTLRQAAGMLTVQSARANLWGTHMPPIPITPRPLPPQPTRASFANLGLKDWRVRGIGPHDLYYPLDIPYDWKITSDASLEIHFTHARKLDKSKSLMRVFVNGFKVADVPLTDRNDTKGRLVIQLLPRQIHPGRNWLHLIFDLHVNHQDCDYRYLHEAWASVSAADSIVNLAHVNSEPPLELYYFPSPLLTPADLSQNVFVLPDTPTQADLTVLIRLAAKLGTYTAADAMRPQVMMASEFSPSVATANHIIAIGQPETNTLLATYNSYFPRPLYQDANGNETSTKEQNGYLQILPAPWSQQGTLMVISAVDNSLLTRVVDVLPTLGQRFKVKGNVAIVTLDQVSGLNVSVPLLEQVARETLSIILFGAFVTIGSIGWLVRRHHSRKQGSEDAN